MIIPISPAPKINHCSTMSFKLPRIISKKKMLLISLGPDFLSCKDNSPHLNVLFLAFSWICMFMNTDIQSYQYRRLWEKQHCLALVNSQSSKMIYLHYQM